jgi:gliding motility-associated lipoprotein GldJ
MKLKILFYIGAILWITSSCSLIKKKKGNVSTTTGWAYNNPKNGGFEYHSGYNQSAGPGLVYIQGGTFAMGRTEQDVMFENNNTPRRVTIGSFYMDETEVRNVDWREYMYWIQRVYPNDREIAKSVVPDTLVWRSELSYNEPYLEYYLRHAAYSEYPVVGVSWLQVDKYCKWRTDRANEVVLINSKKLDANLTQSGDKVFTSDGYLNGMYEGAEGKKPAKNMGKDGGTRRVNISDGLIGPRYRLPTEAEWEYAALGLSGNTEEEVVLGRRIYPWNGNQIRDAKKENRGQMLANSVRGRGDYMGVAGFLNDGNEITAPVQSFQPNDYGLYCMAGNVNEWVQDVYRPGSPSVVNEFQPLRGSVYSNFRRGTDGKMVKNKYGELVKDTVANYANFKDGDAQSIIAEGDDWKANTELSTTSQMYGTATGNVIARISDHSRVFKGGSWKDRTYWLGPGTRRQLDERKATNDIGFRCAMTHLGDSNVN